MILQRLIYVFAAYGVGEALLTLVAFILIQLGHAEASLEWYVAGFRLLNGALASGLVIFSLYHFITWIYDL